MTEIITTVVLASLPFASVLTIALQKSFIIILLYAIVILLFTSSDIGASKDLVLIYARGSGALPLPLINLFLVAMFAYFLSRRYLFRRRSNLTESFTPGSRLFILLIFCVIYLLFGIGLEVPVHEVLSAKGIINIINMCLIVFIVIWGTESVEHLDRLVKVALLCLFLSALYGLVRYIFFGGDPANVYASGLRVNVRLTYQDIGQSILFGFAFAYSILRLMKKQYSTFQERIFFLVLSLLSVFNIIFSFRRNAWTGFFIVLLWLIFILDLKKKIALIMIAALTVTLLSTYVVAKRFTGKNIGGSSYSVTADFRSRGSLDLKKGRFSELWNASTATLERNPVFGFGPWSHYGSKHLKHELGQFAFFTHSGIIHVFFKTGIVGLVLFCWPLVSLFFWTMKRRKLYAKNSKYMILSDAAFAGILFTIPELLFGTPIVIFRHLQITGLLIALVYCAYVFRGNQQVIQELANGAPQRYFTAQKSESYVV